MIFINPVKDNGMKTNSDVILTISIPTYNRPDQIKQQVRLLLPQLTSEVKLIIRDNCSPTPVDTLFTTEEKALFSIVRNNVNIGADANIARCLESCDTEWCWILGDDDYISSNAIKIILNALFKYTDAVWFNFESERNLQISSSYEFYKSLSSATSFGNSFWISKCIYNSRKLKPYMAEYYANLSSMIGQLAVLIAYSINNNFVGYSFTKSFFSFHSPAEWGYGNFIRVTELFIIYFKPKAIKGFEYVLKGMTQQRFHMIKGSMIDKETENKFSLYYRTIQSYGILRTLRTLPKTFLKCTISILVPKCILNLFKIFCIKN